VGEEDRVKSVKADFHIKQEHEDPDIQIEIDKGNIVNIL
jgi:hypothetical protein